MVALLDGPVGDLRRCLFSVVFFPERKPVVQACSTRQRTRLYDRFPFLEGNYREEAAAEIANWTIKQGVRRQPRHSDHVRRQPALENGCGSLESWGCCKLKTGTKL